MQKMHRAMDWDSGKDTIKKKINIICPYCRKINEIPDNSAYNTRFNCSHCGKEWIYLPPTENTAKSNPMSIVFGGIGIIIISLLIFFGLQFLTNLFTKEAPQRPESKIALPESKVALPEKTFGEKMSEIRVGMTTAQVKNLLGEPDSAGEGPRPFKWEETVLEWSYLIQDANYVKRTFTVLFEKSGSEYKVYTWLLQ